MPTVSKMAGLEKWQGCEYGKVTQGSGHDCHESLNML